MIHRSYQFFFVYILVIFSNSCRTADELPSHPTIKYKELTSSKTEEVLVELFSNSNITWHFIVFTRKVSKNTIEKLGKFFLKHYAKKNLTKKTIIMIYIDNGNGFFVERKGKIYLNKYKRGDTIPKPQFPVAIVSVDYKKKKRSFIFKKNDYKKAIKALDNR